MAVIGVFGGSFNPVHLGHIAIAEGVVRSGFADEVWLTLSPLNPLKAGSSDLAPDADRLAMLRLAAEGHPGVGVCDIELSMPRPSYSINTLRELSSRYPDDRFRLVIGGDNWSLFDRWREHDAIIRDFAPVIYPRPGEEPGDVPAGVDVCRGLPLMDVSGTMVRRRVAAGQPVNNLVPPQVYKYIIDHKLYL
ncbi:MAG: nicotinate (nicotinamide) nucleotide adenylyltransferase [Muribaculaceae bacterium]|nr:nicotinate (nicotinamide) nucleotide adenylyltransferase [Muribaculaceae bacterium]